SVAWSRDDRDSTISPTSGALRRVSGELGVIGDARYVRTNLQYQQYVPLNKQYTLAFNGELGWGAGLGGRPFPVFKHFYSGGLGSVRGFDQGTLGPRDITGSSIGGPRKITLNAEAIAPFPGAGNDRSLRVFGFVDVGNVFGEDEPLKVGDLRASVGVGLSWLSPIGPLRLAAAQPVRKQAGDRIQRFQFQIGTSF
ncbi:MAG TPA: BamA/TamA family outer membrane protein, partial [Ramlibacter sp.]